MFQNADDSIQWCCTIAANQRIKRVKKEEKEKKNCLKLTKDARHSPSFTRDNRISFFWFNTLMQVKWRNDITPLKGWQHISAFFLSKGQMYIFFIPDSIEFD